MKLIAGMLSKAFPWCNVQFLQESAASLDVSDKIVCTHEQDVIPCEFMPKSVRAVGARCAASIGHWKPKIDGVDLFPPTSGDLTLHGKVVCRCRPVLRGWDWDKPQ